MAAVDGVLVSAKTKPKKKKKKRKYKKQNKQTNKQTKVKKRKQNDGFSILFPLKHSQQLFFSFAQFDTLVLTFLKIHTGDKEFYTPCDLTRCLILASLCSVRVIL